MNSDYKVWLTELKLKIRSVQLKAAFAVNAALIGFYWELGKMIAEKINESNWGDKILEQVSKDLKDEFPEMKGLSRSNLSYAKQFYLFYQSSIVQQPVGQLLQQPVAALNTLDLNSIVQQAELRLEVISQIPWGHHILIFSKSKDTIEAQFYIGQTIANNWSRDVLALQIKSNLYQRQGRAVTNFTHTLPDPFSDLAQQTLKDPYIFDFIAITTPFVERDIEKQLVQHITQFLLELGKGFAFIGQQYHLEIAESDYYIDLLFYHTKLKCYVVIELKNTKFLPEYAGKLNFYLSAVDSLVKQDDDKPSIGILLCRDKKNIEVEFALRDMNKPMGVSEFNLTEIIPENLKSSLPTIEEIENELKERYEL